jgi:hypothetical protein
MLSGLNHEMTPPHHIHTTSFGFGDRFSSLMKNGAKDGELPVLAMATMPLTLLLIVSNEASCMRRAFKITCCSNLCYLCW